MTRYEQITLQLKVCELTLTQVSLELEYGNYDTSGATNKLKKSQEAIFSLINDIEEACNAQTK